MAGVVKAELAQAQFDVPVSLLLQLPGRGNQSFNFAEVEGPEFVSKGSRTMGLQPWLHLRLLAVGETPDNAFIEAFNSKFCSECLNAHWFMSLDDARLKMEDWGRYYDEEGPHSGIGQKVPILLHNSCGASSPSPAKEAENSGLS